MNRLCLKALTSCHIIHTVYILKNCINCTSLQFLDSNSIAIIFHEVQGKFMIHNTEVKILLSNTCLLANSVNILQTLTGLDLGYLLAKQPI